MTTPDLNIVMPYGVTLEGDGTVYAKIPKDHPKRLNPTRLALPSLQPCRVSASWAENPNPVDVNLYNGNRFVRTLATIQAGGGRSWCRSGRGTATSSNCWGTGIHQSPQVRQALSKSTRSTSSSAPRRGGGVGGGVGFRESANDYIVRRVIGNGRNRASRRGNVSAVAGGRFDGVAVKQDVESSRLSVHGPILIDQILGDGNCTGRNASDSECCGSQRCCSVPQYPRRRRHHSRCGRDHHHLPAGVVAAGGVR